MSKGYYAHFEEESIAQDIAYEADEETAARGRSLGPEPITIPNEELEAQQESFVRLAADGHRGAAELVSAYANSELANRDAQLNYNLFLDAALPAESSAFRFVKIDELAQIDLSEETVDMMTTNRADASTGALTHAPVQAAGASTGATVHSAAKAVSTARTTLRVAHNGVKSNLLEVKKNIFELRREATELEVAGYEEKIEKIGAVLDLVALAFSATSAGSSAAAFHYANAPEGVNGAAQNAAAYGGAVGDVGGYGTAAIKFGVELTMGEKLNKMKAEIATYNSLIFDLAGIQGGLAIQTNLDAFTAALEAYAKAREDLEIAVQSRRKDYATAGLLADSRLVGTEEEGRASQVMLHGGAALEAQMLLDSAIETVAPAHAAVSDAQVKVAKRKRNWYYRSSGGFASGDYEQTVRNPGEGPDVAALKEMSGALTAWNKRALRAKPTLDQVAGTFEAGIIREAGAGDENGEGPVY